MKTESKFEFKPGDIVRDLRFNGEFELVGSPFDCYPLKLYIGTMVYTYTEDGRVDTSHDNPILVLIRRPEEEVKWFRVYYKRTDWAYACQTSTLFTRKEDFLKNEYSKESDYEWIKLEEVKI